MIKVVFTLDYEVHGNGEGSPHQLMVEPTSRLIRLLEDYGAKVTIMADVAEILKFKEYKERHGQDDCHYDKIVEQLQAAVRRGHDVQLHLHASFFNARFEGGRWLQDLSEYNFADLSQQRLNEVVKLGRDFLEDLLKPADPNYKCFAFRAANWAMSPSYKVVRALVDQGIKIDTSVFKYGRRNGLVQFDYTHAYSNQVPWRADENDICRREPSGRLWEFPIYSESKWPICFLTPNRIYRALLGRAHKFSDPIASNQQHSAAVAHRRRTVLDPISWLGRKHAWKADFNQCTGRQLIRALNRGEKNCGDAAGLLPFVLIGHSKLFTRWNERSLRPFLAYVAEHNVRFGFGKFDSFNLQKR